MRMLDEMKKSMKPARGKTKKEPEFPPTKKLLHVILIMENSSLRFPFLLLHKARRGGRGDIVEQPPTADHVY